jgi:hypothetical protein
MNDRGAKPQAADVVIYSVAARFRLPYNASLLGAEKSG